MGQRQHAGSHPLTEDTCDAPFCWCRAASQANSHPFADALGKQVDALMEAEPPMQRLAREFWERAALQAFRDGVWPQDDTKALPMLASIAVQADFLTAEWRKRFDPREGL